MSKKLNNKERIAMILHLLKWNIAFRRAAGQTLSHYDFKNYKNRLVHEKSTFKMKTKNILTIESILKN